MKGLIRKISLFLIYFLFVGSDLFSVIFSISYTTEALIY